jgi:hypothetical protein
LSFLTGRKPGEESAIWFVEEDRCRFAEAGATMEEWRFSAA